MWHDFMVSHAVARPDHLAVVVHDSSRCLSYAQLERENLLWAGRLLARGVKQGDRVALIAPNRLEHLTLFFACAKLGAILVPLNHRLAPLELAAILNELEPRCFLGVGACPVSGDFGYEEIAALEEEAPSLSLPVVTVADDAVMMILYTSGSTGAPKGVMLHAAMLMANMHHTAAADVLRPDDISIVNTPFFHTGGYNVFCLPLLALGGTLILHERFDPGWVLREIREAGVTVFWAVPTMFQAMADHGDFSRTDFSRIRFFLSGGAPLSLALIQGYHRHGVPFKQGFGLTEVGPNCFLLETRDAFDHPDAIGRPMVHSRVRVVDGEGRDVAVGGVGEMWITGPHLCLGYWRQAELFQQSLREGYFTTGDLVRVDGEGFYYVVGRKKEMYISGGENVYPGEVEKQMASHPDVVQVVVVGVGDSVWGEVGLAYYVARREFDLGEMRDFLTSRLARYKHPHYLVRLEVMPLLANGKIDRPRLRAMAAHAVMM